MGVTNDEEKAIIEKTSEDNKSSKCTKNNICICICIMSVITCILLFIFGLYNYINNTINNREKIDRQTTYISEPLVDILSMKQSNCTYVTTCEYTCKYIYIHYDRVPSECEYKDWATEILIIVIALYCFGLWKMCCQKRT